LNPSVHIKSSVMIYIQVESIKWRKTEKEDDKQKYFVIIDINKKNNFQNIFKYKV